LIDLHSHTLFSDGVLLPSELIRRAEVVGIRALALTDHVDSSNVDYVVSQTAQFCESMRGRVKIRAIPGAEITHVPVSLIPDLVQKCRALGAKIVVVHGETLSEPVQPGTNRVAIESGADIVAHPGLISEDDVRLAAEKGVCLELSGRRGHVYANGHVAALATRLGARLVVNSDAHAPGDLIPLEFAKKIIQASGIRDVEKVLQNSKDLIERVS